MSVKLKLILQNISQLLTESTALGVPKIFRSKRIFLKLYWLFFFLFGSFATLFFIQDYIINYLQYEVVTKIESIYQQPMTFPTVSFCAKNSSAFVNKKLSEILLFCLFNLDNSCKLDPENFFESFKSQHLHMCYRFNSGKNLSGHSIPILNSTVSGWDSSLKLQFPLQFNAGLFIWIHDASSAPRPVEYYNSYMGNTILVSENTETHLAVHKTVEEKLGTPYNQCYKDVNIFPGNKTIINFIASQNQTYKQTKCFELCFEIDYLNRNPCNCTNSKLGNVWLDCFINFENRKLFSCTFMDKTNFFKKSVIESCELYCPLECDTLTYTVTQTSFLDKNRSIINIYFENLQYTSIRQLPKISAIELASNLGGLLGLFVGLSFASLFEIGELLIEALFIYFQRKITPNFNNQNKTTSLPSEKSTPKVESLEVINNSDDEI